MIKRRHSLPFLFVNMAMTADGKIATANRAFSSFGSPYDQRHLMQLRAEADAVMAGARTVDLNPVNLGPGPAKYRKLRLERGLAEYNLRIIVSGSGTINPAAKIFSQTFSPIIILTTKRAGRGRVAMLEKLAEVRICGNEEIDFPATLRWLKQKHSVQRLLCEGGGELNDALFRAGLVDELHLTICPFVFGGRNAPTITDGKGFEKLSQAVRLSLLSAKRRGLELFLRYRVQPAATSCHPPSPATINAPKLPLQQKAAATMRLLNKTQ